jgi:hypothetical protein
MGQTASRFSMLQGALRDPLHLVGNKQSTIASLRFVADSFRNCSETCQLVDFHGLREVDALPEAIVLRRFSRRLAIAAMRMHG